jgi:DNA-binding NarL/FixJ family response regulator
MILLASPSKSLCRRWREALAGARPIHEIGDKQALFHFLSEFKPSVLLVDYDTSHFGTISFLRTIIKASPSTRVVILTSNPTSKEAVAAIRAGAKGYARKDLSTSLLKRAARVVSKGEIWIGRQFVSMLIEELGGFKPLSKNGSLKSAGSAHGPYNALNTLSARQREIASLIAIGEPNKTVSSQLGISEKTVKAHLTTIFRKLDVSGRTQLALFVSQSRPLQKDSTPRPLAKPHLEEVQ